MAVAWLAMPLGIADVLTSRGVHPLCAQTYLTPARVFTLEDAIGYVAGDELIEVTPKSIRLRKRTLDPSLRKSQKRKAT